jgi:hypothetical protein
VLANVIQLDHNGGNDGYFIKSLDIQIVSLWNMFELRATVRALFTL